MSAIRSLALTGALAFAAAACAPAPSRPTPPPRAAAPAAEPGASPEALEPGTGRGDPVQLGSIVYSDFGIREISGKPQHVVDAGDFYFKGTFLRGDPGQKVKLRIKNTSQGPHNISIPSQQIDAEIPPGPDRTDVEVTLPESGALRFFCKLHAEQGMNGQLLAGEALPQAIAETAAAGAGS